MKKKGYYEYTPQIYPRKLWVMYNSVACRIYCDSCVYNNRILQK